MNTNKIGSVPFDAIALKNDLKKVAQLMFNSTYSEFICGVWESCALWNQSGSSDQTSIFQYQGAAQQTPYGQAMPYVSELIKAAFHMEHLKLVRLVKLKYNSVIIPHRDFIETGKKFLRFHVPLQTDHQCFSSEENIVYQMREGEVWYLNASIAHSAASFSKQDRLHLILDFDDQKDMKSIVKMPMLEQGIPDHHVVKRPPPDASLQDAVRGLAKIIDAYNFDDILALLIKWHFTKNISADDVYRWLFDVVEQSCNPSLIEHAHNLYGYCMQERTLLKTA